jgi:hypothetical protein
MKDISQQILDAKKIIADLELLNANPDLIGHKQLYDKAIELDIVVQQIIINTADYA